MKASEVRSLLTLNGLTNASIFISDATYAKPTTKWLTGKFYEYFLNWLWKNDLNKWQQKFDCDNFSCLYYAFAQACHTQSGRSEQGILVGEMFFMQKGGGHAINLAITEKGVIFIEPQTGAEITLTKEEKSSCWCVRF